MFRTLGIVEVWEGAAESASEKPCGFLAARRFGGKSLLEWIVRRVTDCQRLEQVVVVCCEGPQQAEIHHCAPPDVAVYVAKAPDPLGCLAAAVKQFAADAIVRVRISSPFIDPSLIDRLVTSAESHSGCDYVSYCLSDGRPAVLAQLGLLGEWCRGSAIRRADREATDPQDRQDSTRYLYRHPDRFQLRLIPVPAPLDRDDLRLGIDVEEDWENAQLIYDALGPESLEWHRIAKLLDAHPDMRERMAVLNRANANA